MHHTEVTNKKLEMQKHTLKRALTTDKMPICFMYCVYKTISVVV